MEYFRHHYIVRIIAMLIMVAALQGAVSEYDFSKNDHSYDLSTASEEIIDSAQSDEADANNTANKGHRVRKSKVKSVRIIRSHATDLIVAQITKVVGGNLLARTHSYPNSIRDLSKLFCMFRI